MPEEIDPNVMKYLEGYSDDVDDERIAAGDIEEVEGMTPELRSFMVGMEEEERPAQDWTAGDVGRQLLQGPALGGIHNIEGVGAGLQAGLQNLTEDASAPFRVMGEEGSGTLVSDMDDAFSEARAAGIDRNELARERLGAPAATALEMAGSLAGSPLMALGKGVTKLGLKYLGKEAAEELVQDVGPKVAEGIIKRMASETKKNATKAGFAKAGARNTASGAFASEGENAEDILKDTALTGAFGGVLGIAGKSARFLNKARIEAKNAKKLNDLGIDADKYYGKDASPAKQRIASFMSKMTQIPEEDIIRYARTPYKQAKMIANKYGAESEKDIANEISKVLEFRLGRSRNKMSQQMKDISAEHFGEDVVPVDVRQALTKRLKSIAENRSSLDPDVAISKEAKKYLKVVQGERKPTAFNDAGEPVAFAQSRPMKMKDILTMFEDISAKTKYSTDAVQKSDSYQKFLRDLMYEGDDSVRAVMSKTSPKIDKVFKRYAELHKINDQMNKNILKEGRSLTAVRKASSKGDVNQKSVKDIDAFTKADNEAGEQTVSDMLRDFQNYRYFEDPDLAAFSTGRSLLAPMLGAGMGSMFGKTGQTIGMGMGTALSSPRLMKYGLDARKAMQAGASGLSDRLSSGLVGPTMEAAAARSFSNRLQE